MKTNSTENEKSLEAMLSAMPVNPREDFTYNVLEKIRAEDSKIDILLKTQPLIPTENFAEKILAECVPAENKKTNTVEFISKFFIAAVAIALIAVPVALQIQNYRETESSQLANKVSEALTNDPELYALAMEPDDNALSLKELISASEILTTVNPSTFEILAANE